MKKKKKRRESTQGATVLMFPIRIQEKSSILTYSNVSDGKTRVIKYKNQILKTK